MFKKIQIIMKISNDFKFIKIDNFLDNKFFGVV